ncbi:PspC domain-containing protein [Pediococcus claussenii]|uniref:Stress-responsive transcriptional regulator n=1 Tax=Pediococcus claussenii (strain ATCC BAA-344 / DSM 14800 / JCM 18046 / KCTC 3811 / LMG 21948 / P06) TaxID=701521 RepID=G8PEN6_PEDCP|nr:PspC domain-containing protein [Pediococcus claussenii]AEV94416.1 Putative stress-responsive transcriptional regulator [Pediococcus claussenii ATCC BAA-344]ANZ69636.1 PspC family transcriptional regulator [Pediococcus claussenii]ANZ71453.1 PspC family transcriptional regulator [Pediococcus claussenii]KRN19880.1 hypothetical protein IV79_GL001169 [Pediococcus claussenii]
MNKKLKKSSDRMFLGVIGGFAETYEIDPTLLRVGYAAASLFFPPLILLYFVAAVVMPE